jgi:hypothetical protein
VRGWSQPLPAISPAFGGLRDARSEFGRRAQVCRGRSNVGRLVEIALRHGTDKAAKAVQVFDAPLGVVIARQHAGVDRYESPCRPPVFKQSLISKCRLESASVRRSKPKAIRCQGTVGLRRRRDCRLRRSLLRSATQVGRSKWHPDGSDRVQGFWRLHGGCLRAADDSFGSRVDGALARTF